MTPEERTGGYVRAEVALAQSVLDKAESIAPLAFVMGTDLELRLRARTLREALERFSKPWLHERMYKLQRQRERESRRLTG